MIQMKYWIVPTDLSHSSACIELTIQGSNCDIIHVVLNTQYHASCILTSILGWEDTLMRLTEGWPVPLGIPKVITLLIHPVNIFL